MLTTTSDREGRYRNPATDGSNLPTRNDVTSVDIEMLDPCLLYVDNDLFHGETTQLRSGPPGTRARLISGEGVQLWIYEIRQPYRVTHALLQDVFHLAMGLQFDGPASHNGVACEPGICVVSTPHEEVEQVVPPGIILEIVADRARARERGWSTERGVIGSLPPWSLRLLGERAAQAYDAPAGKPFDLGGAGVSSEEHLLALVVDMLDGLPQTPGRPLAPRLGPDRARRIVAKATDLAPRLDDEQPPSVALLARRVGVSERTLYRAFSEHLGVSPYRYLLLSRLHRMRRTLLRSPDHRNPVTRAAARAGFDHLGEMGRHYRRVFGETPSETLARSRRTRASFAVPIRA